MSDKRIGVLSQLVPPQPSWAVGDMPDQAGKVVIVTGANRGIGKETARVTIHFFSITPSLSLTNCDYSIH
jgi:hypothetical protein